MIAHTRGVVDVSGYLNDGAIVADEDQLRIGTVGVSTAVAVAELKMAFAKLILVILAVAVADNEEAETFTSIEVEIDRRFAGVEVAAGSLGGCILPNEFNVGDVAVRIELVIPKRILVAGAFTLECYRYRVFVRQAYVRHIDASQISRVDAFYFLEMVKQLFRGLL